MRCPLCDSTNFSRIFSACGMPPSAAILCSNILSSEHGIVDIDIVQCVRCGFIFNLSFDSDKIIECYNSQNYIVKHSVSSSMNKAINGLADLLSPLCDNGIYYEIGAGKGELAGTISDYARKVYTWDPNSYFDEDELLRHHPNWIHYNKFFQEENFPSDVPSADLIVARHLLEHLDNPVKFLAFLREKLCPNGLIYIEVPNVDDIISSLRYYDFFHDHFGYYSPNLLSNLLSSLGFKPIQTLYFYQSQFFGVIASKSPSSNPIPPIRVKYYSDIDVIFHRNIFYLNRLLSKFDKIAIYGAGAQGNSLYSSLSKDLNIIVALDLALNKQGKYLYNSNIPIVAPTRENIANLDAIVIAGSLHEPEIHNQLLEKGYRGEIIRTSTMNF